MRPARALVTVPKTGLIGAPRNAGGETPVATTTGRPPGPRAPGLPNGRALKHLIEATRRPATAGPVRPRAEEVRSATGEGPGLPRTTLAVPAAAPPAVVLGVVRVLARAARAVLDALARPPKRDPAKAPPILLGLAIDVPGHGREATRPSVMAPQLIAEAPRLKDVIATGDPTTQLDPSPQERGKRLLRPHHVPTDAEEAAPKRPHRGRVRRANGEVEVLPTVVAPRPVALIPTSGRPRLRAAVAQAEIVSAGP